MAYPSVWPIFWIFLKLGCSAFGGPVAHLEYFRQAFVEKRKWLDAQSYAELVALCQFLPGPSSSQVGMALGLSQAGLKGALAAWIGFTLPSALLMLALAMGLNSFAHLVPTGALHGLKVAAVAVVAQAVWSMGRSLCPDAPRISLMIGAALIALLMPGVAGQLSAIGLGLVVGLCLLPSAPANSISALRLPLSKTTAVVCLALFIALFGAAFICRLPWVQLFDSFYRSGALIFGGGHVMLPLLEAHTVANGWVSHEAFMAGYGAAQAMPGPLISFAAFLGASSSLMQTPWLAALVCVSAICLPAFLLIAGALPFWQTLRQLPWAQRALMGINASVVGLLIAALYQPVWVSAIFSAKDLALALGAWLALAVWRLAPWMVVLLCAAFGALVG